MRCTLSYQRNERVNPGVVTGAGVVFRLNSVFDPELTGVGHQPREFDTAAALYSKYRVISTDCMIEVRQRASHGIAAALIPTDEPGPFSVADLPLELLRAVQLGVTGSNQPVLRARQRFHNAAVLGQTPAQYMANEDTSALCTTNPAEPTYLHVWAQQLDSATVADYEFSLLMSFDVEFFDKKVLAPSAAAAAVLALRRPPSSGGPSCDDDGDLVDADPRATRPCPMDIDDRRQVSGLALPSRAGEPRAPRPVVSLARAYRSG